MTCHIVIIWLKCSLLITKRLAICKIGPRIRPKPSLKADFSLGVSSVALGPQTSCKAARTKTQWQLEPPCHRVVAVLHHAGSSGATYNSRCSLTPDIPATAWSVAAFSSYRSTLIVQLTSTFRDLEADLLSVICVRRWWCADLPYN